MKYVKLGSTGLEVSPICFGTWRFGMEHGDSGVVETGREEAHELLDALKERDGLFIDTANSYAAVTPSGGSASGSPTATARTT